MPRSDAPGHGPANRLLAALPSREYRRLLPHLEPVPLPFRAVLREPGELISHAYFPCGGVVSQLLAPDGRGGGVEVGLVGREGVVGLTLFLGATSGPRRWVVQAEGEALRMQAAAFQAHAARGALHDLLLRYTNAFLAQVAQTVACNALHPVEARMCRWLLMVRTRVGADHFPLTHQFLAAMLGVRRASVTEAARGLQAEGLIRYRHGRLEVVDRPGLESAACGCHRAIEAELDRMPGGEWRSS